MPRREKKPPKPVPRYLIPGCGKSGAPGLIKKHVARICAPIDDQWRLFSESCLRNRYFRGEVLKRGPNCMACSRKLQDAARIEQHHNDYLWTCIGTLLPEGSEDMGRPPNLENGEFPQVPDCRQCHIDNPDHFAECRRRIYPVHATCHGRIHDNERLIRKQAAEDLKSQFYAAARSWVPADFYLD